MRPVKKSREAALSVMGGTLPILQSDTGQGEVVWSGTVWEREVLAADHRWDGGGNERCLTWKGEGVGLCEMSRNILWTRGTLFSDFFSVVQGKTVENGGGRGV